MLSFHVCLRLPNGLFPSGFPTKTLYTPLLSLIYATCPANLTLLNFIIRKILAEHYRSLSSTSCSFLHPSVTSSLLGPNILLSTLFWNTLNLRSPSMWATKFHTHTKQQTKDVGLIRVNQCCFIYQVSSISIVTTMFHCQVGCFQLRHRSAYNCEENKFILYVSWNGK